MNHEINANENVLMPVLFVPHGGGPMPLLGEPNHRQLIHFLKSVSADLPLPKAILVVTAHWEASSVRLSSHSAPEMLYDYYGFPPESYEFQYPAPGYPELAQTISSHLESVGIDSRLDGVRGFDHGCFVPLMLMYPQAEVPVVQMSLISGLDPEMHLKLGEALAFLRAQGVLIVGSGMSFHNMQAFFSKQASTPARSERFDEWLTETLTAPELSVQERKKRMKNWQDAPEARFCHPREEHLLPLHVCLGAGSVESAVADKVFSGWLFDTKISAFIWR